MAFFDGWYISRGQSGYLAVIVLQTCKCSTNHIDWKIETTEE